MNPLPHLKKIPHIQAPCIMKSLDPRESASGDVIMNFSEALSDAINDDLHSLSLTTCSGDTNTKSLLLLSVEEALCVPNLETFIKELKVDPKQKVKVVSIFGNTGEGKSHALNQIFFNGEKVFHTSASQKSCTLGVWAVYDPKSNVICLDTEGFLGISSKENQRTRMLLKILAVSDIIIYKTRAERLQSDMFTFLGSASEAYKKHFSTALSQILQEFDCDKSATALGPSVIIFHETKFTQTLDECISVNESAEDLIRSRFQELRLGYDAFSSIKYVGIKSTNGASSFREIKHTIDNELKRTDVRSARYPKYIYLTLKALNDKYQNQLSTSVPLLNLSAFFTCQERCLSCKSLCSLSMGHKDESLPHLCDSTCSFQHQYQNCVYLCRSCYKHGEKITVTPKYHTDESWTGFFSYVWSGYSIECPKCGLLYKSRQHWYGNKNPEDCAVRQEIIHIWPDDKIHFQERSLFGAQHSAQKMVDSVTMLSEAIVGVTSQPVKAVSDWMADQVAPTYWRPNNDITKCFKCGLEFTASSKKHHCRSCGEGFCDACSSKKQPVPSRGFYADVRVCDNCYKDAPPSLSAGADSTEVRARVIGETVVNSFSAVKSVLDIPKEFIKDSARPSYWTPDRECTLCDVCSKPFGPLLLLHHCRNCGKGVCDDCSASRKPVYSRGWETPVRVCDKCA